MTDIGPALIGLAGVLVGGIITAGANYLLATRKERADAAKDRRSEMRELKTAARLVSEELLKALSAASYMVERKKSGPKSLYSMDAWHQDKRILAAYLTEEQWGRVTNAALTAASLTLRIEIGEPLSDEETNYIRRMAKMIECGAEALSAYR